MTTQQTGSVFNPFDVEAVADFGKTLMSCDTLGYMKAVKKLLDGYLSAHPDSQFRYGGAFGLSGGHGSGKTHLLVRIAEWAREEKKWTDPTVLYAKADTSNFFDVYRGLVSEDALPRSRIEKLILRCYQRIAIEQVEQAEITKSIASRLKTTEELQQVLRERNLDPERLKRVLSENFAANLFPTQIADILLRVGDPSYGEKAYRWFIGEPVPGVEDLGVEVSLSELGTVEPEKAISDVSAIHALEVLAALHRMGDTPLILLIDQLEVLTRANPDRQMTVYSLIKKLIEELGRQHALIFIAGRTDIWEALPRDIPPRLREREPIEVGILNEEEVGDLLRAYMSRPVSLSQDAMEKLRSLSGGNLREILRICHHVYNRTEGSLEMADPDLLLNCAQKSGTVADRRKLALQTVDKVIGEIGMYQGELVIDQRHAIDRLLLLEQKAWCAVLIITATDPLSEIGSAEKVTSAVRFLEEQFSSVPLVVVSVGYASEEVSGMIAQTAAVIPFDESVFEGQLRSQILQIQSQRPTSAARSAAVEEKILERLESLQTQLGELRERREARLADVHEEFVASSRKRAARDEEARNISTRWEFLERLDDLTDAQDNSDPAREREIVRSLLVANEISIKLGWFDRLGASYVDLLAADTDPRLRKRVLREMRGLLLRSSLLDRWLEFSLGRGVAIAAVIGAFGTAFLQAINFTRSSKLEPIWLWPRTFDPYSQSWEVSGVFGMSLEIAVFAIFSGLFYLAARLLLSLYRDQLWKHNLELEIKYRPSESQD